MTRRIAIVGGGLSGLVAAHECSKLSDASITVFESAERFGGKISSSPLGASIVDDGADAFLLRTSAGSDLCQELGIGELRSPATHHAGVWANDAIQPMPDGLVLGVPARVEALRSSNILSEEGIERACAEPTLDVDPVLHDCSIGALVAERFGREVADRITAPLLGGIAAGNLYSMSLWATVPVLAAAARTPGAWSQNLSRSLPVANGTPSPAFGAPRGGMSALIERLIEALQARGVELLTGHPCAELPEADRVILTTPAWESARLLAASAPLAAALLGQIRHASMAFIGLAYPPGTAAPDPTSSGFLVPRTANRSITAASWSSQKWPHLGQELIVRASIGHIDAPDALGGSDEDLVAQARADLADMAGLSATPVDARVRRYPRSFPQFDVGHLDRITELRHHLRVEAPTVSLCGMAVQGVGIPACIEQAQTAARQASTE